MKKKYPHEVVENGKEIERLLVTERDIIRNKGKLIAKEDVQRRLTEFIVGLFREGKISEETYDYLFDEMSDTSLVFELVDAREMFDKGMDWEEFQEFKRKERTEGRRVL